MMMRGILLAGAALVAATASQAGTLENMERERAMLVSTLLKPELAPEKRQQEVQVSKNRLVDLERMVIRDDSLRGKDTPAVRRAFKDYDRTFLVHASVEKGRTVVDHWLEQVGIDMKAVMDGRIGRR